MFCTICGTKLPDGARFCPQCGLPVGTVESDKPGDSALLSKRCVPEKKYEVQLTNDFSGELLKGTELDGRAFFMDYYVRLEDGTVIGWLAGYLDRDFVKADDYNLYKVNPDGRAAWLGSIHSNDFLSSLFVKNGYAYWKTVNCDWCRKNIDDDEPKEFLPMPD